MFVGVSTKMELCSLNPEKKWLHNKAFCAYDAEDTDVCTTNDQLLLEKEPLTNDCIIPFQALICDGLMSKQ